MANESVPSSHGGDAINNLPPLLFHNIHGKNIRISHDGTVARRIENFCKGITFSSRAVKVNEEVCIQITEVSSIWSGVIRFGFTYNDPSTLIRDDLPKYACPELTNQPGYWMKGLPDRFCTQNTVLFYYVTSAGDVFVGINGEEMGMLFGDVETGRPLWAIIDVYGQTMEIKLLNNNNVLNSSDNTAEETDGILYPMQGLSINQRDNEESQSRRFQLCGLNHLNWKPIVLHRTKGRNVEFNSYRTAVSRTNPEFSQGYVFTSRPVQLGERLVIQVICVQSMLQSYLDVGLTSCDPANLQSDDLPDDSNCLLDRPEYWTISKEFTRHLVRGDEISICTSPNGEVQMSKNGGTPSVVIHVDPTLKLWAFFNICGSMQRMCVLSYQPSLVRNAERQLLKTNPPSLDNLLNQQTASIAQLRSHYSSLYNNSSHSSQYASNQSRPSPLVVRKPSTTSSAALTPVVSPIPTNIEPISRNSTYSRDDEQSKCMICCENSIDCAFYMCGHMCMCFDCALQQWCGKGDGHCPVCRATIKDVIRIYKS